MFSKILKKCIAIYGNKIHFYEFFQNFWSCFAFGRKWKLVRMFLRLDKNYELLWRFWPPIFVNSKKIVQIKNIYLRWYRQLLAPTQGFRCINFTFFFMTSSYLMVTFFITFFELCSLIHINLFYTNYFSWYSYLLIYKTVKVIPPW